SNKVNSNYYMELKGLKRASDSLRRCGLYLARSVHLQIQKWIRENFPGTVHYFDVSMKKKLHALSKEKACNIVCKWMKSITNHLYWSAESSQGEDSSMIVTKWTLSPMLRTFILDMVTSTGSAQTVPLNPENGLKGLKGSCQNVRHSSKQETVDIKKLSTVFQTSYLVSFHSVINHFAPKYDSIFLSRTNVLPVPDISTFQ
ncbi:LOW QUALITY PROTEIN: hypothetical protein MAR_015112, partial [Mya arenaria]